MSSKYAIPVLRCLAAMVACGLLQTAQAGDRDWFELDNKALATIDFEGLSVPTSVAEFQQQFPDAKRDEDRVEEQIGLECFEVSDAKHVDTARFFFCDGRLYQIELIYNLERVKKMGGMQAVVQKLIDTWGPADHIGQRRWTWLRARYQRRADFYTWPNCGQLTISDMTLTPIVGARLKRYDQQTQVDLGF